MFKDVVSGKIVKGLMVVVVLIGNGLKDLNVVIDVYNVKLVVLLNDEEKVFEYI